MRHTLLQEAAVVCSVLALAFAFTIGHPVVLLALGVLLAVPGMVLFWRTGVHGWLLTMGIGGASALVSGIVLLME